MIIVCGPEKSDIPGHGKCICCQHDFPLEHIMTNMCYMCVTGSFNCEQCYSYGVPIDRFWQKRGKLHRVREWWLVDNLEVTTSKFFDAHDGKYLDEDFRPREGCSVVCITACGGLIPYDGCGQAISVRDWCKKCWPEGRK